MNLQYAPADKVVIKNNNLYEILRQTTGVHFPDLNPNYLRHKQPEI